MGAHILCCQLVIVVVIVARFFGHMIKAALRRCITCLLCGYCISKSVANPKRHYVPPYTEGGLTQRRGGSDGVPDMCVVLLYSRVAPCSV